METKKEMNRVELTPEQVKQNIGKVLNNLQQVEDVVKLLPNVVEKEITEFGNSAHIVMPKEHAKKKAIVIIKK